MYLDPNGHDPLPWWANMLIGVGVIAVLAAATVLTAGAAGVGVGAAFAAGFTGTAIGTGLVDWLSQLQVVHLQEQL